MDTWYGLKTAKPPRVKGSVPQFFTTPLMNSFLRVKMWMLWMTESERRHSWMRSSSRMAC